MNCYRHPDRPAVGVCLACGRGLCPDCAAEVGPQLACRQRCETEVEQLYRYRKWAYRVSGRQHVYNRARRYWYVMLGFIALGIGMINGVTARKAGDVSQLWLYIGLAFVGVSFLIYGGKTRDAAWERGCLKCGYNLTGNRTGRCPECGTEIKEHTPEK